MDRITGINIFLLIVLILYLGSFFSQLLVFSVLCLPFYVLSRRWGLSRFECVLLAFPLFALATNVVLLFSVFGITLSKVPLFTILFVLPLAGIIYRYRGEIKNDFDLSFFGTRAFSFGLVLVILVLFCYSGLLTDSALPKTDATEHITKIKFVSDSLDGFGGVFTWYSKQQLGYPIFSFDPYLFSLSVGIFSYFSGSIVADFNFISLVFLALFTLSTFFLSRFLFKDDFIAFCAAALLIAGPKLAVLALFSGNVRIFSAYALVPLLIYHMLRFFEDAKVPKLLPLLLFYQFTSHTNTLLFLFCFFAVSVAYQGIRKMKDRSLNEIFCIFNQPAYTLIHFFALSMFFAIPALYFSEYISTIGWNFEANLDSLLSSIMYPLFSEPTADLDFNTGVYYGIALIVSSILVLFSLYKTFRENEQAHQYIEFILLFPLSFVLLSLLSRIPFLGTTMMGYVRIEPFFLLFFSIVIAAAISMLKGLDPRAGKLAFLIALLMILHYSLITSERSMNSVTESFAPSNLKNPVPFLTQLPERIITYGMYATSIHPAFSFAYKKSTNGLGYLQGQHTNIYYDRLNSIEQGWGIPNTTSTHDAYKLLRITATKTIWINACSRGGNNTISKFDQCKSCNFSSVIQVDNCNYFVFLNTSFAEGFSSAPTFSDYGSLASVTEGYRRPNEQLIILENPHSRYILVKEEYFPRWAAYQEGEGEAPIQKSDIGLMIVENRNNRTITLSYDLFLWEKILLLFSVLLLVLSFFYLRE